MDCAFVCLEGTEGLEKVLLGVVGERISSCDLGLDYSRYFMYELVKQIFHV